jgi:hypothetical protein
MKRAWLVVGIALLAIAVLSTAALADRWEPFSRASRGCGYTSFTLALVSVQFPWLSPLTVPSSLVLGGAAIALDGVARWGSYADLTSGTILGWRKPRFSQGKSGGGYGGGGGGGW